MTELEMNYFYCRETKELYSTTNLDMKWHPRHRITWEKVPYERAKKIAKRLYLYEESDGSFCDNLPF